MKQCIYCERNLNKSNKSRQHVFPKALWDNGLPNNTITVPCCRPCNERLKSDEDYFLNRLVFDERVHNNPNVINKTPRKLDWLRTRQGGTTLEEIGREMFHFLEYSPKSGIIKPRGGIHVKSPIISRAMSRAIQGLLWHEKKTLLPKQYEIKTYCLDECPNKELKNLIIYLPSITTEIKFQAKIIGEEVEYRFVFDGNSKVSSIWHIVIYGVYKFLGYISLKRNNKH